MSFSKINRASILTALSTCILKTSIHDLYDKVVNNKTNEMSAKKFVKLLESLLQKGFVQTVYDYNGKIFWKISERGKMKVVH